MSWKILLFVYQCVLMVLPLFYQFLNDSALQALDIYQVSVNPQTGQYYLRPPRYAVFLVIIIFSLVKLLCCYLLFMFVPIIFSNH